MRNTFTRAAGAVLATSIGITSAVAVAAPASADPGYTGPPPRIKGTVTNGEALLEGIVVSAFVKEQVDGIDQWRQTDQDVTDVNGAYNVGKLNSGTFRIRFEDTTGKYVTEFYKDVTRIEDAQDIVLVAGEGMAKVGAAVLGTTATENPTPENPTPENPTPENPAPENPAPGNPAPGNPAPENPSTGTPVTETPSTTTTSPTATTPAPTGTQASVTTTTASAVTVAVRPRIRGIAKVAKVLKVTKGTWTPSTVTKKIQWLANGKRIKGATKNKLRLTKKLAGKRISVRVVASAPGLTSLKITTKRTKQVRR